MAATACTVHIRWARCLFRRIPKKKGENLATHEDIEKLKDQVRVVTTTTKEIEAKISNEVWDRQKRWELKRDVLFEVAKSLAEVEDGLGGLDAVAQVFRDESDPACLSSIHERHNKWLRCYARFDAAKLLAHTVCESETILAIELLGTVYAEVAARLAEKKDRQVYGSSLRERATKLSAVKAAIRKELGVPEIQQRPNGSVD